MDDQEARRLVGILATNKMGDEVPGGGLGPLLLALGHVVAQTAQALEELAEQNVKINEKVNELRKLIIEDNTEEVHNG